MTRRPIRRPLSRLCFAGAAASLLMAAAGPAVFGAEESAIPDAYTSDAFATTVQVKFAPNPPPLPLEEFVRLDIPHGESHFGTGPFAKARASVLHPGTTVTDGFTLACQFGFPCSDIEGFPPVYPLNADAIYPTQPEAEPPVAGQTVEFPGVLRYSVADVHAVAEADHTETVATLSDLSFVDLAGALEPVVGPLGAILEPAPDQTALVDIDSLTAVTHQEFVDGGVRSYAESVLDGVGLLAGTMQIDSIRVRSESTSVPGDEAASAPVVEVSGVTVAGQAAELTNKGLFVAGEQIDSLQGNSPLTLPVVANAVEGLLGSFGMEVRLLGSDEVTDLDTTSGSAAGVALHFELNLLNLPLAGTTGVFDLVLGEAGTAAAASSFTAPDLGVPSLPAAPSAPTLTATPFDAGTAVLDSSVGAFTPSAAPDGTVGGGAVVVPGTPGTLSVTSPLELLSGVVGDRMTWFYLAWTLSALGLALGSRVGGIRVRSTE